ncbi:hypothetical protein PLESTB_000660900 [Pleodorina starrii]|uniref:Uncharacterized protein n=1 Tax=Pleodorina starrii TaxID=330485 RepID=A0A9W6BI97_9CHLO|nr:hypothetical protein PLESTM_001319700 [Pleodorina starrii]GLC52721.1 hypothetical protein PLESTB_000660900 [Pleodorina starrii]
MWLKDIINARLQKRIQAGAELERGQPARGHDLESTLRLGKSTRPSKKSAGSSELFYSTDPEEVKLKLAERRELRSKHSKTPEDEKRLAEVTAWLCARTVPV